ncbi:hypothetical protein IC615_22370 [Serratia ureilytica]
MLVLKRSKSACYLTGLLFLMTMLWALWESGLNYWALFPRLLVPAGLSIIAAFLLPSYLHGAKSRKQAYIAGSALSVAFVAFFIGAFFPHGEITPAGDVTFIEQKRQRACRLERLWPHDGRNALRAVQSGEPFNRQRSETRLGVSHRRFPAGRGPKYPARD